MTFLWLPRHLWWRVTVMVLGTLMLGSVLSDTLGVSEWLFDLPLEETDQTEAVPVEEDPVVPEDPPVTPPIETPVYAAWIAWQSPTYLLLKEDITLSEYTCDSAQSVCKINLLVTPQKDGADDSQLTCLIVADFDLVAGADPCNPNTSVLPAWEYHITIQILQKSDNTLVATRELLLKNPPIDTTIDPLRVTASLAWQSPTYLLLREDTTLSEYTCDPEQAECKVNLMVTPFLDGIPSSDLTCSITADFEIIPSVSDPCNPNTSIVPVGDHILTITIRQLSDGTLLQTREILLKNPPIDTSIDPLRITASLAWQSPTYLLLKADTSLAEYSCDPAQPECKINLLFTPLLDGMESSQLTCEITSDFPLEPTTDVCNPNTSLVPKWDHILSIKILQKSDNSLLSTRDILIKNPVVTGASWGGSSSGGWGWSAPLMDLTASHITIQSGLDPDGTCRSDICQVNLLAEVPSDALCHWNFWTGIFETTGTDTKCNPWYVKFPFDTTVVLTVFDPLNPLNQTVQSIFVRHETSRTSLFPEARIDIQGTIGKNKRVTSQWVICEIGNDEACSLNFTGDKSINAERYFWDFWNQVTSDKENPSAQKYPLWEYTVRLTVTHESGESSEAYYAVQVVKKFDAPPEEECLDCAEMVWKIQISAVLPNPPHTDTVEWIEIRNISSENWNLDACTLSDDTKTYALSETVLGQQTLRFRQRTTGISLGNSHDTVELRCGEILVDTFSWSFEVPSGYILRREMLSMLPTQADVVQVIDGDTIDVMLYNKRTRVRLLGVDTPETVHPRKAVEKFGKEASDFTTRILTGKTVWVTFDHELLDIYGRTLAYIWECQDTFERNRCTMFNTRLISEGYGRMERRFAFMYYDEFSTLEWVTKKAKRGIWSDPEVAKALGDIGDSEEEQLKKEQEEEYLKLQKELLELEKLKCKEEGTCEDRVSWADVTKKMSTLSVRANTAGALNISGRTWGGFPVKISFFLWDTLVHSADITTDSIGEYSMQWYPKVLWEYRVEVMLYNPEPAWTEVPEEESVTLEKKSILEKLSDHFLHILTGGIVVQGIQGTNNRWRGEDGVFHCLSRGSCSVNLIAEVNRKTGIRYEWILPDGSASTEKNPPALKLGYGDSTATLKITDEITGESTESQLHIQHRAIPKAAKKASSPSSKYTIDLKDATLDIGGGVMPESSSSGIWATLITLFLLSISSFILFWKYQPNNFIDK